MFIGRVFAILNRILPTEEAFAHCDIPCGIYDPHMAQIGALTVVRMNQLIDGLEHPSGGEPGDHDNYVNSLARYIAVKEEHAELVKHEVRIIWGDFFKPDNRPDGLHDLVDKIMKLASKCRQNVDAQAADELLEEVNKFAEAFWKAKGVATKRQPSNQAVGGEVVLPAA
jgi:nickel superoxide dismutase